MTNEEIIAAFPECERIKKENIADCINSLFGEVKNYHEINKYITSAMEKFWPRDENWKYDDPDYVEWRDYFWGTYRPKSLEMKNPVGDWIKSIEEEYLTRFGKMRTYEEACQKLADKWCELIFGFHIQDNGAINEDHGGGFWACALGSAIKNDAVAKIGEDVIKKTHDLMVQWYRERETGGYHEDFGVDYGPNCYLYDLLVKAGVDKRDASSICPWKTHISIDRRDNSIYYGTYGKAEYL